MVYDLKEKLLPAVSLLLFINLLFSSCTEEKVLFFNRVKVKNYPADTPFVYNNKIEVKGKLSKAEKTRLEENLNNYWADSLLAPRVQKAGVLYSLKNPPVFDTSSLRTTERFMTGYLFSQGYFHAAADDSVRIDTVNINGRQLRTTITMTLEPGGRTIIDSLSYNLNSKNLQRITLNNAKKSVIKPGKTPFSNEIIAEELNRLVSIYRNRGYFKMIRNNILAEVDTVNVALLKASLDPLAQAELLEEANVANNAPPTASMSIQLSNDIDSSSIVTDTSYKKRFYVGRTFFYPETSTYDYPDSLVNHQQDFKQRGNRAFTVLYKQGLFRNKIFSQYAYLRPGRLYTDDNYTKTLNTLSQIGAWKQVDSRTIVRGDTVDFHYFLYPDKKQNLTYNFELSRNTGDFLSSANLFGVAGNVTYRNRNVWHRAVQASTSLRAGVELSFDSNLPLLQSTQFSVGQSYSFPRLITPFKVRQERRLDIGRTIINFNAAYSDRSNFFRLRSLVTSYSWEWKSRNHIWQLKPLNIELYSLDTLPLLQQAFTNNTFLKTSFNTGSVIGHQAGLNITYNGNSPRITNYVRFAVEEAGSFFALIPGLQNNIYQYAKFEAEFRKQVLFNANTSFAFRAYGGVGYNYGGVDKFGKTLPFFKQFVAGGPNSMRAWGLRLLGLGSSLLSDTASGFRDRYGDMQLETNFEYRYLILHFTSVNINGALFTDIGNVWNIRKDESNPLANFELDRLGKDIAIGVGTGLRLDFKFFLIRLDLGIKLKDPAMLANNGWLDVANFTWRNYEFAKYDADGNLTSAKRNNYALQLGIGLPF